MSDLQFPHILMNPEEHKTELAEESETSSELGKYLVQPALLHIPLVLLLRTYPLLGIIYVISLLVIGLTQLRKDKPEGFLMVCGYIASAELIWRMTEVPVFWETGKYLLTLLMGLGILRWKIKPANKPLLYLLMLIPSAILTLQLVNLGTAQDYLSFNLSGPLLMGVGAAFFSTISISRKTFNRMLLYSIVPITSVWLLALSSTLSSDVILFRNLSNFTTSGGYGPNQVSALLGLGVFYCWLYLFTARPKGLGFWMLIGVSLALLAQAILTFSRGGVFNLAFAIPAATFFFTRGQKQRQRNVFGVILLTGLALIFLIPRLNQFTSGSLLNRYENLSLTGRDQIMRADLQLWLENPILGVGAGISSLKRAETSSMVDVASHTEYTRLLAEHGIFGLLAILLMFSMVWKAFHQARGGLAKGTAIGLSLWALAEMVHAAMRIAAVSFVFALPLAQLEFEDECGS